MRLSILHEGDDHRLQQFIAKAAPLHIKLRRVAGMIELEGSEDLDSAISKINEILHGADSIGLMPHDHITKTSWPDEKPQSWTAYWVFGSDAKPVRLTLTSDGHLSVSTYHGIEIDPNTSTAMDILRHIYRNMQP